MPASRRHRAGAGAASTPAKPSATSSAMCSATSSARAASRRPLAGVPRRRPALRARARSRSGRVRPLASRSKSRSSGRVRDLQRQRRGQGQQRPSTCDTCGGIGPGAHLAGLLPAAADLSALPRRRHHRQESLRHLPRAGPRAAHARRSPSRFRPAWTRATASAWRRRRGGPQRRAAGRSLRRDPRARARRSSSATAST